MPVTINGTTGITTPGVTNSGNETVSGTLAVTGAVTGSGLSTTLYPLVSGTAVASTSGTSIDFTGIPSWVKRITVMFNGISISSNTPYGIVQIGSGSVTTSGYVNTLTTLVPASTVSTTSFTSGFAFINFGSAADTVNGILVLTTLGSNVWVASGTFTNSNSLRGIITAGNITLGGVLDRVRITTTDGTTTFDAGSINILYE